MLAIVTNSVILVGLAVYFGVIRPRAQSRGRLSPPLRTVHEAYVPPEWRSGPVTDWIVQTPMRVFLRLTLIPVCGAIAGVVLLGTHHSWGGSLGLASIVGAMRVWRSGNAYRALQAARSRYRH